MGTCGMENNKNRKYNVNDIFNMKIKNEFYYFTQIFVRFQYYKKINNINNNELILISKVEDPKKNNLSEIIKTLDQVSNLKIPKYEPKFIFEKNNNEKKEEKINNDGNSNIKNEEEDNSENKIKIIKFKQEENIIISLEENPNYTFTLLFEKLYFANKRKFIDILKKGPPNNLRWFIWLAISKGKYLDIQYSLKINNEEIFTSIKNLLEEKKEVNNNFKSELKNCLSETKLLKENFWLINYYNLVNYITYYHKYLFLITEIHNLAFFPFVVSDGDIINTFYFLRFFFSFNYGLGVSKFFGKNNFYIIGISSITMSILKSKNKELYNHISSLDLCYDDWINNWVISFYSNILNISITIRLWDCIIAIGLKFIIYYNIAFIDYFKKKIFDLNTKNKFLTFFNKKLRDLYKNEEDIITFREKLIELAFEKTIEDDFLKFHIISFIKNLKINQATDLYKNLNKKKNNEKEKEEEDDDEYDDDDEEEEDEEEEIIREKEKLKKNFFNLFGINQENNEQKEDNYEIKLLKGFIKDKEIVNETNSNNNQNEKNPLEINNNINDNNIKNKFVQFNNSSEKNNEDIQQNIEEENKNVINKNKDINDSSENMSDDMEENEENENENKNIINKKTEKKDLTNGEYDLEMREEQDTKKL